MTDKRKLPEGWRWEKLKNTGNLSQGGTPSTDILEYWNGTIPFITGADITNLEVSNARSFLTEKGFNSGKTTKCEKGDLLMVSRTRVGRVGLPSTKLGISQDVSVLKPNDRFYAKYIALFLKSMSSRLEEACQGATIKGLTRDFLENILIPLPPTIEDQIAIASELERRMNEVENMRQAALRQKEAINAMHGAVLREAVPFNEDDKLPDGWRWESLDNLFIIDKQQIDRTSPLFSKLPFIGLENIESNTRKYIPSNAIEESAQSTCFRFDETHVLYGKLRPYLNKVYLPNEPGRCSMELLPLRSKNSYSRDFIAAVLQSEMVMHYAVKHSTGIRMPRADMNKLIKFKVPVPINPEDCNFISDELKRKMIKIETMRQTADSQLHAIEALPGAYLREVFEFADS